jgi:hypothetical protein
LSGASAAQAFLFLALLVASFECYHAISADAPRRQAVAQQHAARLTALERRLGIFWEPATQQRVIAAPSRAAGVRAALVHVAHYLAVRIYRGGQVQWLVGLLLWLYLFRRHLVRRMLTAIVSTTMVAVSVSAVWPVAPPRFALAGSPYFVRDLTGTISSEQVLVHSVGFNPYSSFPSVHVLWALLTALGLWYAAPNPAVRVAALIFPAATTMAVIVTGNHYVIDCVGSAVLLGLYLVLEALSCRVMLYLGARRRAAPRRWAPVYDPSPLRGPLIFCACAGWVLMAGDPLERTAGVLAMLSGACMIVIARGRSHAAGARPLHLSADWWGALLFLVGSTAIDAHLLMSRLIAGALWLVAVMLPLRARLPRSPRQLAGITRHVILTCGLPDGGNLLPSPIPQRDAPASTMAESA